MISPSLQFPLVPEPCSETHTINVISQSISSEGVTIVCVLVHS